MQNKIARKIPDEEDVGYIFIDHTAEGRRVQTVIMDARTKEEAREMADAELRAQGFVVGGN